MGLKNSNIYVRGCPENSVTDNLVPHNSVSDNSISDNLVLGQFGAMTIRYWTIFNYLTTFHFLWYKVIFVCSVLAYISITYLVLAYTPVT